MFLVFCCFYFYLLYLTFVPFNQEIRVFQFWEMFLYYFFDNFFAILYSALFLEVTGYILSHLD